MKRTTCDHLWQLWMWMKQRSKLLTVVTCGIALELVNPLGSHFATANSVSSQMYAQGLPISLPTQSLTLAQLQNATYQIPLLGKITLVNGVYQSQGQPSVSVALSKKYVIGNLNQDGVSDAVTVLRVTEPNRKPTYYLAAIVNQNGQPNNVDTVSIGQGFKVKSLLVNGPQITVTLLKYGPRDAPCCPSAEMSQSYRFNTGSDELIATSFALQTPNPGGLPVSDISLPINAQINNNIPGSPYATEIEF